MSTTLFHCGKGKCRHILQMQQEASPCQGNKNILKFLENAWAREQNAGTLASCLLTRLVGHLSVHPSTLTGALETGSLSNGSENVPRLMAIAGMMLKGNHRAIRRCSFPL